MADRLGGERKRRRDRPLNRDAGEAGNVLFISIANGHGLAGTGVAGPFLVTNRIVRPVGRLRGETHTHTHTYSYTLIHTHAHRYTYTHMHICYRKTVAELSASFRHFADRNDIKHQRKLLIRGALLR